MLEKLEKRIESIAYPEKAKVYMWYFKSGKGKYGERDKFDTYFLISKSLYS